MPKSSLQLAVKPAEVVPYLELLDFSESFPCTAKMYLTMHNDCTNCPFIADNYGCLLDARSNPSIITTIRILREQYPAYFI